MRGWWKVGGFLALASAPGQARAGDAALADVLAGQLTAAMATWTVEGEVPHYVAVAVEDHDSLHVYARQGAIASSDDDAGRTLDVDLRLGTAALDSTHNLRGFSAFDDDTRDVVEVAYTGPGQTDALQHAVWRELDARWRDARERIVLLRANQQVRVAEEDPAPDFEPRTGAIADVATPPLTIDAEGWEEVLRAASAILDDSDVVVSSSASLDASRTVRTFVDTEGARLVTGRRHARVSLQAAVVADDGDRVSAFRAFDVEDPAALPDRPAVLDAARALVAQVEALRRAPRAGPYTGPVLLSGKASGVFFHEVLGHRVEGHRNKDETEGKTFKDYVGRPVLPSFLSVVDDPTVRQVGGVDLNGTYAYDDEGVAAQPAQLVDHGVFTGFLMGRSPLAAFPHSNGHGRRSTGNAPAARMGNTLVHADRTVDDARLRAMLLDELRRQHLAFGYIVDEIEGGFTMTGRVTPNAFNVRASRTWRVYVDGRPDELVRGIDLVGTPLAAFQSIVAAGSTVSVFNGVCGAESGWVPVSAVAPALLFRRLEMQLKEKGSERPPLLSKPGRDGTVDAAEVAP
ncbi:MAG: TldD/PmbA family protein [Alphaproteobacteria bacterium]|nr:TldD/PmbA family protein [Alphaproteobacteria bacterium]